jgi:hypothetical protein
VRVPSPLPRRAVLPHDRVGDHLLPSPVLCGLGARSHLLSGPQPVVHHVVTARALALPQAGSFVGGLRPWDLPGGRHPSYAASICCRFRIFTLRIHGYLQASHNRRERELRRLVLGRKNWLFTWLDDGGERTANILSIVATCIAHDVNPRAYLHKAVHCILHGWPQDKLRDLLPDRMLASHPELYFGDPDALPLPTSRALPR